MEKKRKQVWIEGPISAQFIADAIAKHQAKTNIGAHNIFLGQVRADEIDGKPVKAIDYTAYQEMADEALHQIREAAFAKYNLTCLHIYHSLGRVPAGEICLFVFVSATRRKEVFEATSFLVEAIKKEAPIFGKEVFADESYVWKSNALGESSV